jgi:hypothetical protein
MDIALHLRCIPLWSHKVIAFPSGPVFQNEITNLLTKYEFFCAFYSDEQKILKKNGTCQSKPEGLEKSRWLQKGCHETGKMRLFHPLRQAFRRTTRSQNPDLAQPLWYIRAIAEWSMYLGPELSSLLVLMELWPTLGWSAPFCWMTACQWWWQKSSPFKFLPVEMEQRYPYEPFTGTEQPLCFEKIMFSKR